MRWPMVGAEGGDRQSIEWLTRQPLVSGPSGCRPPRPTRPAPDMKLHQLKALVAVADQGSARAAARACGVSPAAITKAVRELEAALKIKLVLHLSTGSTFTEPGRLLLVRARLAVEQLQRAEHEIDALTCRPGKLRVGVAAWVAMTYLGDTVRRFQQRMPDVRLEFFEGAPSVAVPKLRDGTLDLCIGRSPPPPFDAEFCFAPLFRTTSAVVARHGHPLADSRSLSQLEGAQWVLNGLPAATPVDADDVLGSFLRLSGAIVHIAHTPLAMISLVRSTDLLGLMAWPMIENWVPHDNLQVVALTETLNDVATGLIQRRGEPPSAAARHFIDCFDGVVRSSESGADPIRRRVLRSIDDVG